MRTAVTGSNGFLGRWVIKVLNEVGIDNRGIDISGNGDHIQVDLGVYSHARSALAEIKPDAVIHLAALAGASGKGGGVESLKAPYEYFKTNTMVALNVFEACRELGIKKVIAMSSFSPYGKAEVPITEETPLDPNNPYGGSKQNVETIAKVYARCFGIKTLIFRVPLMCGESQRELNALREFAKAAFHGQPLVLWSDGSTLREFVHPSDVARAYVAGLKYLDDMIEPYEVFVLGNNPVSMKELAEKVIDAVGKGKVEYLSEKPKLFDQWTKRDKVESKLGWFPKIAIHEIVERVVTEMKIEDSQ